MFIFGLDSLLCAPCVQVANRTRWRAEAQPVAIHRHKMTGSQVRVALGQHRRGVAEKRLKPVEVAAVHHEVGGERMPQIVEPDNPYSCAAARRAQVATQGDVPGKQFARSGSGENEIARRHQTPTLQDRL